MALASQTGRARDYRPRGRGVAGRYVWRVLALVLVAVGVLVVYRVCFWTPAPFVSGRAAALPAAVGGDARHEEAKAQAADPTPAQSAPPLAVHAAPEPAVVSGASAKGATVPSHAAGDAAGSGAVPMGVISAAPVKAPAAAAGPIQLAQAPMAEMAPAHPAPAAAPAVPAAPAATQPATTRPALAAATQPAELPAPKTTRELAELARQGMEMLDQGKPVEGRALLSNLLVDYARDLSPDDAHAIREALTRINQDLVFSAHVVAGDPLVEQYTVQFGDVLTRIVPKYQVPYPAIELINNVKADRIRAEQKLKMIRGPFGVVVHKADYRLDLFLNDPAGKPVYIRSFSIGLGEGNSTPDGAWLVAGKTTKPSWTNPRTGQMVGPDDPNNPLGGYWIHLKGADAQTANLDGYGIHGTNQPESVGKQMSMGCIRLLPDDIALLYKLLSSGHSTVRIAP